MTVRSHSFNDSVRSRHRSLSCVSAFDDRGITMIFELSGPEVSDRIEMLRWT